MKSPFYNFDTKKINNDKYINDKIEKYEGPFISSIPDIKIFDLTINDKYLVIGSDGLWDYLNSKEIAKLTEELLDNREQNFNDNDKNDKIALGLMKEVIEKSSIKSGIDFLNILDMQLGKRLRRIHDDISIIICDLSKISEN